MRVLSLFVVALMISAALPGETRAKEPMWTERFGQAATVFRDRIWLVGGTEKGELRQRWPAGSSSAKSDVWSSSDGKKWTCATQKAPWRGRYDHSLIVFKDRLWVLGGIHDEKGRGPGSAYCADVWSSPDGTNWDCALTTAPWGGRSLQKTVVYDEKLWLIGGEREASDVGSHDMSFNDVWMSEDGIHWRMILAHGPWALREPIGACAFPGSNQSRGKDRLCVIALTGQRAGIRKEMTDEIGVWYSADGLNWRKSEGLRTPHTLDAAVAVRNECIWFFGGKWGQDAYYSAQVWASSSGADWVPARYCAPWGPRAKQSVVVLKNSFFLLGGVLDGAYTNDVWYSEDGDQWEQLRKTGEQHLWKTETFMTSDYTEAYKEKARKWRVREEETEIRAMEAGEKRD